MVVQWWSIIPFVAMLLSIAILPLVPATAHHWAHPRTQLAVALGLGLPVAAWFVVGGDGASVVHALVEYAQFITLLLALFVVSGGIFLAGDLRATPRTNTAFLAAGAVIASFIGTTGAAMLLIRPILNTNSERKRKAHTVIFTILIVANCGGVLTPLGDPPLFLGFLRGVPFEWTLRLLPEWLFVNALLLLTYHALDWREHNREQPTDLRADEARVTRLGVRGKRHFVFLAAVVGAVAFLPSIDLHAIEEGHAGLSAWVPLREIVMLAAAGASLATGDRRTRYVDNEFTYEPILEVAALFVGIFLTMIPALKYLAQVAPGLPLSDVTFFVFTGGLSAVLDNAPTYLTFFEMAAQLPGDPRVAGVPESYLVAISLGAVFCGAITYIGNGPNFMVKSVAEKSGVAMPSFGGYVVWTVRYLVPVLAAMVLIFIASGLLTTALGVVLAVALVVRSLVMLRREVTASG